MMRVTVLLYMLAIVASLLSGGPPPMPKRTREQLAALTNAAPATAAQPKTNAPNSVTLGWSWPDVRFEIWQSTDLQTWSFYTNAPCDVAFRAPADKGQQFFKVRAVDPKTGAVSDWSK